MTQDALTKDTLINRQELSARTGLTRAEVQSAIKSGLLHPTSVRFGSGPSGGGLTFTSTDADLINVAFQYADACGLPFSTMLRLIRKGSAQVDVNTGGITLNLPTYQRL